jgi:hypothetical protein
VTSGQSVPAPTLDAVLVKNIPVQIPLSSRNAGRGVDHEQEAHAMLALLAVSEDGKVRTAAERALTLLGPPTG